MIPGLLRSRPAGLVAAALVLIFLFVGLAHHQNYEFPKLSHGDADKADDASDSSTSVPATADDDELRKFYIEQVMKPSIKVDESKYKPWGAFEWKFPEDGTPKWHEPLGKDICIFDLDDRGYDENGQVFGSEVLSWDNSDHLHGLSLGVLQHWLYAKIHGYQYYYVQTGSFSDRRGSWKKPPILRRALEKHKTCVYLDSDAIFNHMDLPLEWLMNYWDIDPETNSMALSIDPKAEHNRDRKGKLYDNTGFIISQNRPITFDLLDDWTVCADDGGKHPDCVDYRNVAFGRPSDQGGFGNFIRYDYADEVKELPCAEANGFPEDHSECLGTFIKHLWSGKKDLIKIAIGQMIPGKFLEVFHKQLLAEKDDFFITEEQMMKDEWLKKPLAGSDAAAPESDDPKAKAAVSSNS